MLNKIGFVMLLVLGAMLTACSTPIDPAAEPNLTIRDVWARPSPSGAEMGATYFVIENSGGTDALIGVSGDVSADIEIHEMTMDGDIMRMRPVEGQRLEIPAGGSVALEPGGYHIMLIGLHEQLEMDNEFTLTLTFERSGTRTITVKVSDSAPGGGDHGDMDMDDGHTMP